jgi:hypothetical protein
MRMASFLVALLLPSTAVAQELPPCPEGYSVCLTEEQRKKVVESVKELDDIRSSKAEVQLKDQVVIVEDWDGRVYVNGGSTKPLRGRLTIGKHVDRELAVELPVRVYYRPKPPDPMFRLRFRAQVGVLIPEAVRSVRDESLEPFADAGLSLDFFHVDIVNVAAYLGARSLGGGLGIDLTKNFGAYAGYALTYDWNSSVLSGAYFAFN